MGSSTVVAYERRTEDRRERHWWQTGRIRCCSIIDSEQSAIADTADRLFTAVQVVAGGMGQLCSTTMRKRHASCEFDALASGRPSEPELWLGREGGKSRCGREFRDGRGRREGQRACERLNTGCKSRAKEGRSRSLTIPTSSEVPAETSQRLLTVTRRDTP